MVTSIKYKTKNFLNRWIECYIKQRDTILIIYSDAKLTKIKCTINLNDIVITNGDAICGKKLSLLVIENEKNHLLLFNDNSIYQEFYKIMHDFIKNKDVNNINNIISSINDAILVIDNLGGILLINNECLDLIEFPMNEIINQNISVLTQIDIFNISKDTKTNNNAIINKKNKKKIIVNLNIDEMIFNKNKYFMLTLKKVNSEIINSEIESLKNMLNSSKLKLKIKNKGIQDQIEKTVDETYDWLYDKLSILEIKCDILENKNLNIIDKYNKIKNDMEIVNNISYKIKLFICNDKNSDEFIEKCKKKFIEEIPLFIREVDKFSYQYFEQNFIDDKMIQHAQQIYDMYIDINGNKPLNTDDKTRKLILKKIQSLNFDYKLFNSLIDECLELILSEYKLFIYEKFQENI